MTLNANLYLDRKSSVVVLVNDDLTQRATLSGFLRKEGLSVFAFQMVEEALAFMSTAAPPDLIVTDLHMPGIDGWRFCRLLRSGEYARYNKVPVLAVSSTFSGEDPARISNALGANAFLPAPVDAKVFLDHVRALLAGTILPKTTSVLIVEDSRATADMLARSFVSSGYHARKASGGQEALQIFSEVRPDIVVLDYHLPDMDAEHLLTEFNRLDPRCTVVVMTADQNPDLALKMMKLSARAYVRKPFDPGYLIELCENARRELSLLHIETLLDGRTRELRESEAKYRFLTEKMNDIIWIADLDFRVTFISPSIEKVLGFTPEERMTHDPARTMSPDSFRRALELLFSELEREKQEGVDPNRSVKLDIEYYRKDGTTVWMESVMSAIRDAEGRIVAIHGVSRDITESRLAEEERLRIEKLQGIVEVAGTICHEINQPMQIISGNVDLLLNSPVSDDNAVKTKLAIMKEQVGRVKKISGKLMTITEEYYKTIDYIGLSRIIDLCTIPERDQP